MTTGRLQGTRWGDADAVYIHDGGGYRTMHLSKFIELCT